MRHMAAPKHVENRNKRTWKKKCASSWLFTKTKSCCLFLNFQSTCHYCMIPSDCNVCVVWLTSFQILINWTPHLRVKTFSAYDKIGAKMKRNPVLGVVCDEGSYWVLSHTSGYFIWIGNTGEPPLICCPRLLIQYIRSYPPYCRPFLHPQSEDAPRRGDRDALITEYLLNHCNSTGWFIWNKTQSCIVESTGTSLPLSLFPVLLLCHRVSYSNPATRCCSAYTAMQLHCDRGWCDGKLTLRWQMSYIYGAPILDVSRSHTTTQHSR